MERFYCGTRSWRSSYYGLDSGVYLEYHIQYYNLISVLYITIVIVIAHLVTPKEYEWTKNTISELAAQGYDRKWIMQIGFMVFGLILGMGSLVRLLQFEEQWYTGIPILVYAASILASGIFCTKPFTGEKRYSERQFRLHSFFAQLAGVSLTAGILLNFFVAESLIGKMIHFGFLLFVSISSMLFGKRQSLKGVTQRILWLGSFIWLAVFY